MNWTSCSSTRCQHDNSSRPESTWLVGTSCHSSRRQTYNLTKNFGGGREQTVSEMNRQMRDDCNKETEMDVSRYGAGGFRSSRNWRRRSLIRGAIGDRSDAYRSVSIGKRLSLLTSTVTCRGCVRCLALSSGLTEHMGTGFSVQLFFRNQKRYRLSVMTCLSIRSDFATLRSL